METPVYVDVLLVLNYIINLLLILCVAKFSGRMPKRRRIVAAALFASAGSLTIFLPFLGFLPSVLVKLFLSSMIVLIAFPYTGFGAFCMQLFQFFAMSFFFAGIMLGLWMVAAPRGMIYYNGVVYFDISSITLIAGTAAAYLLLSLFHRFSRAGRLRTQIYRTTIRLGEGKVELKGLVDTGNHLADPFSDTPVLISHLDKVGPLLPQKTVESIRKGNYIEGDSGEIPLRLIPYNSVGKAGLIPAFRPDGVELERDGERYAVERVYVGVAREKIGDDRFDAILNPDLIGVKIRQGGAIH